MLPCGLLFSFTGQCSQFTSGASTLAALALFRPVCRRMQGFIDRCFYRRKYDAAKTLEFLSAKLRDRADLDALKVNLVIVRNTMQPRQILLWLRSPKGKR
jgi:hypothetical protein